MTMAKKGKNKIHQNRENSPQRVTTQNTEKKIKLSTRGFVRSYDILASQEVQELCLHCDMTFRKSIKFIVPLQGLFYIL